MSTKDYSYIGKGPLYARDRSGTKGLVPIGNASQNDINVEVSEQTQPDYTTGGGGAANKVDRVDSVGVTITMLDLSPHNLAMALRGTRNELSGGTTVSGEKHSGGPGQLIAFDELPDMSDATNTLTVTLDPDGTATAMTEGDDYEITNVGVRLLEGGTNVAEGITVGVDYTKAAQTIVEALTDAALEFELVQDGLNEAQSGKAVLVRYHRVKFAPTTGLSLLGDEFASMQLEGTVLADSSKTGTGVSKFFQVMQEQ